MCVAVIGGMERLEKHYRSEAERLGIELAVYNRGRTGLASSLQNVDAMVIFTNKTSHSCKLKAQEVACKRGIPVYLFHSCGVCTLRECLQGLRQSPH